MLMLIYVVLFATAAHGVAAIDSVEVDILSRMMEDQCSKELNYKKLNALFSNSSIKYTSTVIDGEYNYTVVEYICVLDSVVFVDLYYICNMAVV